MSLNFPTSPTLNQTYVYQNATYIYDGARWKPVAIEYSYSGDNKSSNTTIVSLDLSKGNVFNIEPMEDIIEVEFTNPPDAVQSFTVKVGADDFYDSSWNVSGATYDNVSFLLSGQDTQPTDVTFKPDGTKMYMVGLTNDRVYQYTLSTPWDLSTATYDSVSFLVSGQEPDPYQVAFKPDGTKMYVLGSTNNRIYQYTLSIPWDISTASYDDINFSTASQDIQPYGLDFKSDGTKMYIMGLNSDRVYQYSIASTTPIIIWPTNISWENGSTAPAAPDRGSDFVYYFHTSDGGTTYYGKLIKKDLL